MTLHSFVADSHTVDHFRNKMTRTKAVYDESDVFQNCGRCIAVQKDVGVCKFFFCSYDILSVWVSSMHLY